MRLLFLPALLALAALSPCGEGRAESPRERARALIARYHMELLPGESGYLALIGQSPVAVSVDGKRLPAQNQVYYLLTAEEPVNYLHWLASDDTHILLEGGPVDYFLFHPDGHVEKRTLGRDAAKGEVLVVPVPAGCWKALQLHPGAAFALMANVLSPAWSADRVRIGAGPRWLSTYAGKAPWATPAFLRSLIGPNFRAGS